MVDFYECCKRCVLLHRTEVAARDNTNLSLRSENRRVVTMSRRPRQLNITDREREIRSFN